MFKSIDVSDTLVNRSKQISFQISYNELSI